jgi:hypothetical protein
MRKNLISAIALALVAAAAGTASAGGQSGSLGVGAEVDVAGVGGPSLNFDGGMFHVGGFLAFADDAALVGGGFGGNGTTLGVGGRFYYHLHSTAMSDFGVGGHLSVLTFNPEGDGESQTGIFITPGAQIRAFVASNVALSGGIGFVIAAGDAEGLKLDGNLTGSFGFHYYFF